MNQELKDEIIDMIVQEYGQSVWEEFLLSIMTDTVDLVNTYMEEGV